jgi:hypothetical protein
MKQIAFILVMFSCFILKAQEIESPFDDDGMIHIMQQKPYDSPIQNVYGELPEEKVNIATEIREAFDDWFYGKKCKKCPITDREYEAILVGGTLLFIHFNNKYYEKTIFTLRVGSNSQREGV